MRAVRSEARQPGPTRTAPRRPLRPARALAAGLALCAAAALAASELAAPGTPASHVYAARVIGVPGSASLRVVQGHGELLVRHLPPPPPGSIYQVWLKRPARPPAPTRALFSVTARGAGDIGVPGSLHGVSEILVTQEPAGGTLVPTHPPVIVAHL